MEKNHAFWWAIIVVAGLFTGLYGIELLEMSQGTQLQLSSAANKLTGFAVSEGVTGFAVEGSSVVDISNGDPYSVSFGYQSAKQEHGVWKLGYWSPVQTFFQIGDKIVTVIPSGKPETADQVTVQMAIFDAALQQKLWESSGEISLPKDKPVKMVPLQGLVFSLTASKITSGDISFVLTARKEGEEIKAVPVTGGVPEIEETTVLDFSGAGDLSDPKLQSANFKYVPAQKRGATNFLAHWEPVQVFYKDEENYLVTIVPQDKPVKDKSVKLNMIVFDANMKKLYESGTFDLSKGKAKEVFASSDLMLKLNAEGITAQSFILKTEKTTAAPAGGAAVTPTPTGAISCPASLSNYDVNKDGAVDKLDMQALATFDTKLAGQAGVCPACPIQSVVGGAGTVMPGEEAEVEKGIEIEEEAVPFCSSLKDCKANSECQGKQLVDGKFCIWSLIEGDTKVSNKRKGACTSQTACININGDCYEQDVFYTSNYICGGDNQWLPCGTTSADNNNGAVSFLGTFTCNGVKWEKTAEKAEEEEAPACSTLDDCKTKETCKGKQFGTDNAAKPLYCVWSKADGKQTAKRKQLCTDAKMCVDTVGVCHSSNSLNPTSKYICGAGMKKPEEGQNDWLKCTKTGEESAGFVCDGKKWKLKTAGGAAAEPKDTAPIVVFGEETNKVDHFVGEKYTELVAAQDPEGDAITKFEITSVKSCMFSKFKGMTCEGTVLSKIKNMIKIDAKGVAQEDGTTSTITWTTPVKGIYSITVKVTSKQTDKKALSTEKTYTLTIKEKTTPPSGEEEEEEKKS